MKEKTPKDYSIAKVEFKGRAKRIPPAQRAKNYIASGDINDLGKGMSRTLARVYLPTHLLLDKSKDSTSNALDDDLNGNRSEYRKPKGFSPKQQALREKLIKEIQALTGDEKYDGVGHRLAAEEDSHRWHAVKGGMNPARLSHSILHGHGHH
jgi:hypothetical protein